MAEPVKKAAEQAEERLEKVAENVREGFDKIASRFADRVKEGRFADQVDHGIDKGRDDARHWKRG
ncbi:hypothetical protein [Micromonospora deserti]|uniref:Antitoxin n=1 Tax=Micromonospora deserti TaxID=2070366 RepID=A0A2W2D065_9ACTN|nr:hypothetical protein [Micromonospora deserti]PZF97148.1 hypothetical protein C1I99_16195 [Micromonospora deserti]